MENTDKDKIKALRLNGYGYKKIARELDISLNTVKSYCRSNNLTTKDIQNMSVCKYCLKAIIQKDKTKTIKFCSDNCRKRWWNENRNKINRKTAISKTCKYCSAEFLAYKYQNRKYCSHDCYIEDRFGTVHHG